MYTTEAEFYLGKMNLFDRLRKLTQATKRACTLWLKPRIGFHTIWTRPSGSFQLDDFEVLTLITSALSWKQHNGPMWLYTDELGAAWVYSNGLGWLYDRVHVTLDEIPQEIDAKLFWAAGKLFAYQQAPLGSVSIDYDAIIWKRMPHYFAHDIVALHPEPTSWGGYKKGPIQSIYGDEAINWKTDSLNSSVLVFNDQALKDAYTADAIRFMLECSNAGRRSEAYTGLFGPGTVTYIEEMIFAEQRLLVITAKKLEKDIGFITGFDMQLEHAVRNDLVSHLWNSKRGYKVHERARAHYMHYLLCYLHKHHPRVLKTLVHLGFCASVTMDANVPVPRFSPHGDWALPGESTEYF